MFIIEFSSNSGEWARSTNTTPRGFFATAEEAQRVVDSEERKPQARGLRYRIAPLPTPADPELIKLRDKLSRIRAVMND